MKAESALLHDYQQPGATMTLREGLAEYQAAYPELIDPYASGAPKTAELFLCHDACHIVFGTNTQLIQEAMTDMWTLWGTDVGFRRYLDYLSEPVATGILNDLGEEIGWLAVGVEMLRSVKPVFQIWRRTRRQRQRWTFFGWEGYLDVPLAEIRREFGIEVINPPIGREAQLAPMRHASTNTAS